MIDYRRLLSLLAVAYGAVFVIILAFSDSGSSVRSDSLFNMPSPFYMAQEVNHHHEPLEKKAFLRHFEDLDLDQTTQLELKSAINAAIALQNAPKPNPFALLGGYSDVDLSHYFKTLAYDTPHYSLINEDDYCDKVDLYNLEHPENMFEKMNFFTDAPRTSVLKSRVVSKIGTPFMSHIDVNIPLNVSQTRTTKIPKEITTFHIMTYLFLKHHQMGKHFLCATQMFNHILNASDLIYKTQIIQKVQEYSLMYKDKPQCFNKDTFTPPSYRLYVKSECEEFFRIITSEQYKESLKTEPIQYIIKLGRDTHRATGVFLLDTNKTQSIHTEYDYGRKCGQVKEVYMAQKYISNPLLLDNSNKFHMRVYLLIASVNPFIVYFQDGYIRASIFPFDKFSEDRATHLTNLLAGDFVEARKQNKTLYGMTPQELDDYQIWTLERLQNYLLQTGKITDTNWLENYLRPAIQKSFMHLIRMTGGNFWKQSNMFELFGCDFMMDDDLNVYFIEANFNPQLDVSNPNIVAKMLEDLYEVQYAIYRSRMKRVIDVINRMKEATANEPGQDLSKWKELYQEASKNKLEPEFKLKETNTFKLVMDESLPGAQAYLGNLPEECL